MPELLASSGIAQMNLDKRGSPLRTGVAQRVGVVGECSGVKDHGGAGIDSLMYPTDQFGL